ncbi:MAG: hypothetical protein QM785_15570 [Pyrinomonadaceae bacterium]
MESGIATFEMIGEINLLAERAFVFRLKEKYPDITPEQIEIEICNWLKDRPEAEFGDGEGRIGDISRFYKR